MHKNKEGKVVASLTEVKNKTGDIFALVDEFGEVFLTSYNKIRYKISKTDISNVVSLQEEEKKVSTPKVKKVKSVDVPVVKAAEVVPVEPVEEVKPEPVVEAPKKVVEEKKPEPVKEEPAEEPEEKEAAQEEDDFASKMSKYQSWDRNNKNEKSFTDKSLQPLVNN